MELGQVVDYIYEYNDLHGYREKKRKKNHRSGRPRRLTGMRSGGKRWRSVRT